MRLGLALSILLVASCESEAPRLRVHTVVSGIQTIEVSVYSATEVLVDGQVIPGSDEEIEFPIDIAVQRNGRDDELRFDVWGKAAGEDIAFGSSSISVAGDDVLGTIELSAFSSDCDGDRIPDVADGCAEVPDTEQFDLDVSGMNDACEPAATCYDNLLQNGDFEGGVAGWRLSSTTSFVPISSGHESDGAGRACKINSGVDESYDIDIPGAVNGVDAGEAFRFTGWIRSDSTLSQFLTLELSERDSAGDMVGANRTTGAALTSTWQSISVELRASGPDTSLKLQVKSNDAQDDTCFDVDSLCLQRIYLCDE